MVTLRSFSVDVTRNDSLSSLNKPERLHYTPHTHTILTLIIKYMSQIHVVCSRAAAAAVRRAGRKNKLIRGARTTGDPIIIVAIHFPTATVHKRRAVFLIGRHNLPNAPPIMSLSYRGVTQRNPSHRKTHANRSTLGLRQSTMTKRKRSPFLHARSPGILRQKDTR